MGTPVIVEAGRTAIGKRNGFFADTHAAHLLSKVQQGVLARSGVDPLSIGQLVGGCVTQAGEQEATSHVPRGSAHRCLTKLLRPQLIVSADHLNRQIT